MDPITVFLVALAVAVAVALAHVTVRIRAAIKAWRLRMSLAVPIALAVVLAWWAFGVPLPWQIPTVAAALVAFIAWRRWGRVAARVTRWGERERRKSGVASTLDVARTASTLAMRCTAKNVRPSLASMSFWERMRVETAAFAVQLARIGRLWAWASIEDIVFVFGGPRTGKSGWLGGRVLDAPGAAIVSSTRTDLLELTSPHRAKKGPVLVFNATDEATIESTITFDPLMGCDNPVVALQRANDLLSVSPDTGVGGDRQYWIDQAARVLAALLYAAAHGRCSMQDVAEWVGDPDSAPVVKYLRRGGDRSFEIDYQQFAETIRKNSRTGTSITSSIMPALGWLKSPSARAAASPARHKTLQALLDSDATVYLLGDKDSESAPLVAAFNGYVLREARAISRRQPKGRLDPSLTLILDEAALLSPPLDDMASDCGGRNITVIASYQSRAQMLHRWGPVGTGVILNNVGATLVFGGKDLDDTEYWSKRTGQRDEVVTTYDDYGRPKSTTTRKVPVISTARIENMPMFHVMVFRNRMPVAVGRAQMAWERRDVRAADGRTVWTRWARYVEIFTGWIVTPAPVADPNVVPIDSRRQEHADAA